MQANDSIVCGYSCIEFIDFILNGKILLDYTNLFSPNLSETNHKMMLEYFQELRINFFMNKFLKAIDEKNKFIRH